MGLFDKKFCSICNAKIGLLGNRKLEDGNLCKDCASKLSPWFSDRRQSTVADIRNQLAYREANRENVSAFHVTRSLGRNTKVLLDEDARKFMVTSARNYIEDNPDVLDYSQVTGCELDVDEHKRELKHADREGKQVSYIPPRYEYSYDFYTIIHVNHPFFDQIRFRLNSSTVNVGENRVGETSAFGRRPGTRPTPNLKAQVVSGVLGALAGETMGSNPSWNPEYNEYYNLGQEIRTALTEARQEVRDQVAARNAPKMAVTCPCCGATTVPDASGCCEYCGGSVYK